MDIKNQVNKAMGGFLACAIIMGLGGAYGIVYAIQLHSNELLIFFICLILVSLMLIASLDMLGKAIRQNDKEITTLKAEVEELKKKQ
jgi:hypothetical protein